MHLWYSNLDLFKYCECWIIQSPLFTEYLDVTPLLVHISNTQEYFKDQLKKTALEYDLIHMTPINIYEI